MNEAKQPTNPIKFLIWLAIGVGWFVEWTALALTGRYLKIKDF